MSRLIYSIRIHWTKQSFGLILKSSHSLFSNQFSMANTVLSFVFVTCLLLTMTNDASGKRFPVKMFDLFRCCQQIRCIQSWREFWTGRCVLLDTRPTKCKCLDKGGRMNTGNLKNIIKTFEAPGA